MKQAKVKVNHISGPLDQAVLNDVAHGVTIYDDTQKWKSPKFHGIVDSEGNLRIRETYTWAINLDSLTIVRD